MSIAKEFKTFALRGNLVDLAIGVVIGGAFGKVVTAFIDGLVGTLTGGVDFNNKFIPLGAKVADAVKANPTLPLDEAKKLGAVWAYGSFITVLIDFLIVAFVIFLVIKAMNKLQKKEAEAPAATPEPTQSELLLTEIRDLLKRQP
jgi:large conductance mechanosensitive channel